MRVYVCRADGGKKTSSKGGSQSDKSFALNTKSHRRKGEKKLRKGRRVANRTSPLSASLTVFWESRSMYRLHVCIYE